MSFWGRKATKTTPATKPDSPAPLKTMAIPRIPMGFETVVGVNTTLLGELRCQSDVRIDGTFEGTLEIEGNVLVGETGKVNANIHAKNVSIAGAVRGDISGKKVQLLRTARIWGNINASAITTEEGAFIDGKLSMVQHEASTEGMDIASLPAPHEQLMLNDTEPDVLEGETIHEPDSPAKEAKPES